VCDGLFGLDPAFETGAWFAFDEILGWINTLPVKWVDKGVVYDRVHDLRPVCLIRRGAESRKVSHMCNDVIYLDEDAVIARVERAVRAAGGVMRFIDSNRLHPADIAQARYATDPSRRRFSRRLMHAVGLDIVERYVEKRQ